MVSATTRWSLTNAASSGDGTETGDFAVVPGEDRTIGFTDDYTQDATIITANRTVDLLKGTQTVNANGKVKAVGKRGALVKLTATAKGNANYRPWTKTWTWLVEPTKR